MDGSVSVTVGAWPRLLCILTNVVGLASQGNTLGEEMVCFFFSKTNLVEVSEKYRKIILKIKSSMNLTARGNQGNFEMCLPNWFWEITLKI